MISPFFARKVSAEARSPPQELEVGPLSGPYLLVIIKIEQGFPEGYKKDSHSLKKLKVIPWNQLVMSVICWWHVALEKVY